MPKYADKYPHPGPRPPEEAEPGAFTGDAIFKAWRERAERMQAWQTKRRQFGVATAIDNVLDDARARAITMGRSDWAFTASEAGNLIVWLSYLQEPLPEEYFQ
jgi:hypothetical protein